MGKKGKTVKRPKQKKNDNKDKPILKPEDLE
jgi:hypothetical protein